MTRAIDSYRIGEVVDSCWEVVSVFVTDGSTHPVYRLKNQNNGLVVDISDQQFREVARERISVSRIVHFRINKQKWHKKGKKPFVEEK